MISDTRGSHVQSSINEICFVRLAASGRSKAHACVIRSSDGSRCRVIKADANNSRCAVMRVTLLLDFQSVGEKEPGESNDAYPDIAFRAVR